MERRTILLEDGWTFALGNELPGAAQFRPVRIPHDWTVSRAVDPQAPLDMAQGFFRRGEVGWYRYTVKLSQKQPDRCFFLEFGGVWECADVKVNGTPVGGQHYGYTPFRLDVTRAMHAGGNEILVRVDNTREPADRWYSGCGIYRPVHLLETDRVHLCAEDVAVRTVIKAGFSELMIDTGLDACVHARLTGPDGHTAADAEDREKICLRVDAPQLWSAETPVLYTLTLQLRDGDALSMRVGLREVKADAQGLRVNGQTVHLRGVCLHQDLGCLGIAARPELWRDRLVQLKRLGCNALRLAHHMHSSEMLDLCDEMGFYVYSECFDKWHSGLYGRYFDTDWQHDLSAMIFRDRNRPSVIIWGVGNEVENQGQDSMVETLAMLTGYARRLDGTRPVTYAMNPHFKRAGRKIDFSTVRDIQQLVDEVDEREITDLDERLDCICAIAQHVDIVACNYQEQWFDAIHRRVPDKPVLSTEAYPFFMGHYDSMQNYTLRIPALEAETRPWALGSFIWTGYDYLGESMGWPSKGWTGSLLRMDASPRVSAWILKSHWTQEPMVHLSLLDNALGDELTKAHWASPPYEDVWDFPGLHQGVVPYLIATNCERVEIHCADRVFYPPLPASAPDGYLTGFLPWIPGRVEVLGFMGGTCVCRHALYTPGRPKRLVLAPMTERALLPGQAMYLTASVMDAENHPCIRDERNIRFRVSGDAEILAVENANLMETAPYGGEQYPAWHGRASVVVRRTGPGRCCLEADADGLDCACFLWDEDGSGSMQDM